MPQTQSDPCDSCDLQCVNDTQVNECRAGCPPDDDHCRRVCAIPFYDCFINECLNKGQCCVEVCPPPPRTPCQNCHDVCGDLLSNCQDACSDSPNFDQCDKDCKYNLSRCSIDCFSAGDCCQEGCQPPPSRQDIKTISRQQAPYMRQTRMNLNHWMPVRNAAQTQWSPARNVAQTQWSPVRNAAQTQWSPYDEQINPLLARQYKKSQ